jgi:hypothetical protein
MLTVERTPFMSRVSPKVVSTNADTQLPVMSADASIQAARAAWQRLIDFSLIEWGRDPDRFTDEGVEAPDGEIVRLAIAVAERFRDQGDPAPNSVVPDPNGGIVFERRENGSSEVVHIWDDGHVEYMRFEGTRLVARETLLV